MNTNLINCAVALLLSGTAVHAAPIYLNSDNISVSVGAGTGAGSSNNTFSNGVGIEKVIDAPSSDAEEIHNQTTHIWYTFNSVTDGLELIFDFGTSYDITELHFWNYTAEGFDVDQVDFAFFDTAGSQIGMQSLNPALGSSGGIEAEDIALVSPLNTQSVSVFLTGTNGQVDFQNIGFTATASVVVTPPPPVAAVPLPAAGLMLLAGLGAFGALRRKS